MIHEVLIEIIQVKGSDWTSRSGVRTIVRPSVPKKKSVRDEHALLIVHHKLTFS